MVPKGVDEIKAEGDRARRVKDAELVLVLIEVDSAFRPDAAVRHAQQRGGEEVPLNSAVIEVRAEGDDVLGDPSADRI